MDQSIKTHSTMTINIMILCIMTDC
jgi:hypothetical protein